jgi:hypothetical protein
MKKQPQQKTLSYSLHIEYLGFRDHELEDTVIPGVGLQLYKKFGVYCVFAGTANMYPDTYVDRLMTGTETTEPAEWIGIPPTQEIFFELDRYIDRDSMIEFMMHLYEYWEGLKPLLVFSLCAGVQDVDDDECKSYELDKNASYDINVFDIL